jgi:fumarylacetoacetate (FAA) hydrolase
VKLASLKHGRDGALVVVDRSLTRAAPAQEIARTLQAALDDWAGVAPELERLSRKVNDGTAPGLMAFDPAAAAAPLPRAYHWVDGSAYLVHVELVRKARGAEVPASFYTDPLVYQGGSDDLLGPCDPIVATDDAVGIDLEAEVAVITDDVPMSTTPAAAQSHIKLVMLANDVTFRNLIPNELAKGFGFYLSKPATAFSPVAVTPDELGEAWDGGRIALPLVSHVRGRPFGRPNAAEDLTFDFRQLIAHVSRTRRLGAGTIIGSGTVANRDTDAVGSSCIAERRTLETIRTGSPQTPFLTFGDDVRIEMFDRDGRSIFGAIAQTVRRAPGAVLAEAV